MLSLQELQHELSTDHKTMGALSDFLLCNAAQIQFVLQLLQEPESIGLITTKNDRSKEVHLKYGYYSFKQPKKKQGEYRTISMPDDRLKELQTSLALRTEKISLSTAAIGGERGFDHIQNAKFHRYNLYMYSIDLKDAFPSVHTDRIYKNASSSLARTFQFSYPYLNSDQLKLLTMTLSYLMTHADSLPQGTKTSMKMLNVVMAAIDQEVIAYMHQDSNFFVNPRYTRYADDAVMSYEDVLGVKEHTAYLRGEWQKVYALLRNIHTPEAADLFRKELRALLYEVFNTNSFSRAKMSVKFLTAVKDALHSYQQGKDIFSYKHGEEQIINDRIKNVEITIQKVGGGNGAGTIHDVRENVRKMFHNQGRQIQEEKEHLRYPGSHHELREVTGVTLNPQGELGVPKKQLEKYIEFMKKALTTPELLGSKFYKDGKLLPYKVRKSIQGNKIHIERIRGKGNLPSEYKYRYDKVLEKLQEEGKTEKVEKLKVES